MNTRFCQWMILFAVGLAFESLWAAEAGDLARSLTIDAAPWAWSPLAKDERLLLAYISVVQPRHEFREGLATMELCAGAWPRLGNGGSRWMPATTGESVRVLAHEGPVGLVIRSYPDRKAALAVIEFGGNENNLSFAWLAPTQKHEADRRDTDATFALAPLSAHEWVQRPYQRAARIEFGEPEAGELWSLKKPALGYFRGAVFVAGDGYRGQDKAIWATKLKEPKDRRLKAALLGKGREPALLAGGDNLFCLGIEPGPWGPVPEEERAGRLVGWASTDGENWQAWDPGIPMEDVVSVDACEGQEKSLLACMSGFPNATIHLYEFDGASRKLREVHSFAVPEPAGIARRVVVRSMNGTPLLFWCRPKQGSTTIYLERVELARRPQPAPGGPPAPKPAQPAPAE